MLKVAVVGAGPVGIALGKALAEAGHTLVAYATTDPGRQEEVKTQLPGMLITDVATAIKGVDLILFAIPGKEIPQLIAGLVETNSLMPGQIVVSTSPDFGFEVFENAYSVGVIPMSIHPAVKFTGFSVIDRARLKESYIAVDAPSVALPMVVTLAIELGGEPIQVPTEARAAYAEAISVASTFTNLIVGQAINLLQDAGIEKPRNLLAGILRSSLEESLRNSVSEIDPADLLDGDIE